MVRELMHDPLFLARKARPAELGDIPIANDLLETLLAHRDTCVGMAANMIGQAVAIIAFFDGSTPMVMYNPEILKGENPYETEEGCLSLLGGPRKTKRFEKIKVRWQNENFQTRIKTFTGWTAQIIQHEVDHCHGVLI
ncbi:MAG: peptide deformylase [Ruminococcaceae bacterium]|nr:peptide deformylase [Oscillospiraceae bacterium]